MSQTFCAPSALAPSTPSTPVDLSEVAAVTIAAPRDLVERNVSTIAAPRTLAAVAPAQVPKPCQ